MNKTLLILTSTVFVLAGCQDEAPDKPLSQTPPEQVTESETVKITEGIETVESQAVATISAASSTEVRVDTPQESDQQRLEHSARNSLDWEGLYMGTLPCADCSGIATSLTLNFDGTYVYEQNYLGKGKEGEYKSTGEYIWNSKGDTVMLSKQDDSQQFFVGENVLMMLDVDGNKVQGEMAQNYNLVQQE
ncbi:copper resistance protein NlpE [Vibrio kasasachensis]|uniref:copper resistance protein NlpE n=1 Tax=Vibrio kasasachensis TaxID=2910248 RepID=UPI003D0A315E